jgi:hypothetical protein
VAAVNICPDQNDWEYVSIVPENFGNGAAANVPRSSCGCSGTPLRGVPQRPQ